jgi:hypothetical protein
MHSYSSMRSKTKVQAQPTRTTMRYEAAVRAREREAAEEQPRTQWLVLPTNRESQPPAGAAGGRRRCRATADTPGAWLMVGWRWAVRWRLLLLRRAVGSKKRSKLSQSTLSYQFWPSKHNRFRYCGIDRLCREKKYYAYADSPPIERRTTLHTSTFEPLSEHPMPEVRSLRNNLEYRFD